MQSPCGRKEHGEKGLRESFRLKYRYERKLGVAGGGVAQQKSAHQAGRGRGTVTLRMKGVKLEGDVISFAFQTAVPGHHVEN